MKLTKTFSLFFTTISFVCYSQQPTTSATTQTALQQKTQLTEQSLIKQIPLKNIGPTVMSGRVVDLEVNPNDPTEFYAGYASGGVWHTTNNGTTFTPITNTAQTQNVGDIAVDWNTKTIWIGTGENNSSRSSYAGIGILKSTDNGKTWQNMGLKDAHHIGRILINPKNPNHVIVGVTGHLYSENENRGMYATTDGGKTWQKKLYIDAQSGIIDVQAAPEDFNILYAASWTRERKAWNFSGNGHNSALYKSTDAGENWSKISTKDSGFPTGEGVGRIGLAVFNKNTVYALLDSQFRRTAESKTQHSNILNKEDFKTMSVETFLKLEDKKLNGFLKQNGFQEKYRAQNVKQMVKNGHVKPVDLAHYLEDANAMLFDTPVIGAEVFKTTNGGKKWNKTHTENIGNLYYSYGYYFGEIRVDPQDENGIYVLGVPVLKSKDGGKTFTNISKENVHADHQALWVNPKKQGHLIDGNDGGINMTYDDGENWIKNNSPAVGQFYAINIDHQKPYHVYGGLQDNGVWHGPYNAPEDKKWLQEGQYPWTRIMGGDGMQIQIDNRNNDHVYTGYQFGNYFRINTSTNEQIYIQPKHQLGEMPYRFNWQTPILLSSHNQDILYLGGNKLMRSLNKGDHWEAISNDLTQGRKKGNVAYGTLTTISESPFQFGVIYTGSDDGLVQLTKNSGNDWTIISKSFPKDLWVTRLIASQHKKERVYVTLNGYRWDDFNSYVYVSDNYGTTWTNIAVTLPGSPVNVIKEDPENENILYLGTDNGAYMSFNKGENWQIFSNGIPSVAVHDMVIQPEEKHLLIGTHGRSIYLVDIKNIQEMTTEKLNQPLTLFTPKTIRHSKYWGNFYGNKTQAYEATTTLEFYSLKAEKKTLKIISEDNILLNEISVHAIKGFNAVDYNLTISEKASKTLQKKHSQLKINKAENGTYYLPKGDYLLKTDTQTKTLTIK